ncbi:MAG: hypothetical protein V4604_00585 [Bacteroidota bacterium]
MSKMIALIFLVFCARFGFLQEKVTSVEIVRVTNLGKEIDKISGKTIIIDGYAYKQNKYKREKPVQCDSLSKLLNRAVIDSIFVNDTLYHCDPIYEHSYLLIFHTEQKHAKVDYTYSFSWPVSCADPASSEYLTHIHSELVAVRKRKGKAPKS